MSSLRDFSIPEAYNQIRSMDTLVGLEPIVDWNALGSMVSSLFKNNTEKDGRPNFDEINMIKTLFIQELYGLSDEATERELYDRISFRHFLHYPDKMPDARTIWLFRERLSSSGMDNGLHQFKMAQYSIGLYICTNIYVGREVKEGVVFKSPCGSRGDALMAGRTYTVEEKYNIIFESISTNQAITEICRKHGISPSIYQI